MSAFNSKKILVLMTGSIAAYKVCHVLSQLKQSGHQLKVVMSPSSLQFVGTATIEGLTGEAPITQMYSAGNVMDHINLIRWADLVLVAPATAHYINKIAHGLGDDLLSTLFLAHDFAKPFLIAPAMNTKMYLHPVTQESIQKLKKMDIQILETASGVLACGEIGSGRLLEPDAILKEVEIQLSKLISTATKSSFPENNMKPPLQVLITAGGTSESIDDVRVITNKSTGQTAAQLADALISTGFQVTYLHSPSSQKPNLNCELKSYTDFKSLEKLIGTTLQETQFHTVIHAAAVSDYSVSPTQGKISSDQEEVVLKLKKNPKLINNIKKQSPNSNLIAFKLTSQLSDNDVWKKINSLFEKTNSEFVIQNDWQDVKNRTQKYRLYSKSPQPDFKEIESTEALHASILQIILSKGAL